MEGDKKGIRCCLEECRQIDFMAVHCKYCRLPFCSEHYSIELHHCSEFNHHFKKVLLCPFCSLSFRMDTTKSAEDNLAIHEANQCKGGSNKHRVEPRCLQCKKKVTQLNKFDCKGCSGQYCLQHRLKEDHSCRDRRPMPSGQMRWPIKSN